MYVSRLFAFGPLFCLAALSACSTFISAKRVEIKSVPPGAEVSTLKGDLIGQTPLILEGETLDKYSEHDHLVIVLNYPNHVQRELVLETHGEDSHEVILSKLDSDYFARRLIQEYAPQNNEMIRELLRLQGLLIVRKIDLAEQGLNAFIKKYPSIAAPYVMLANVSQMRGDEKSAEAYLLRARSIDPADPVSARMMQRKKGKE